MDCIKGSERWSRGDGHVIATFTLPLHSDALYLFARGRKLSGNVVITQDDSLRKPDVVLVDVVAQHHTADWLHLVSVCSLARVEGERGIGIFVSY